MGAPCPEGYSPVLTRQECIEAAALRLFEADEAKFHAAGREDVDVRMLGEGRPFVLELLRPKRPYRTSAAQIAHLEAEINASQQMVRVRGLGPCASDVIGGLVKQGEDSHRKDYRCVVRVGRRLGHGGAVLGRRAVSRGDGRGQGGGGARDGVQGMGWTTTEELIWGDAQHKWVYP